MLIYAAHVERRQFLGLISVKKLIKNQESYKMFTLREESNAEETFARR